MFLDVELDLAFINVVIHFSVLQIQTIIRASIIRSFSVHLSIIFLTSGLIFLLY